MVDARKRIRAHHPLPLLRRGGESRSISSSTNSEKVFLSIGIELPWSVICMHALFQRFLSPAPLPSIIGDKIVKTATQIAFLCLLWAGCGFVGPSLAQLYAAERVNLTGRVLDLQGAVVPGAKLRLDNRAQTVGRGTTSDAHGSFTFQAVDPGNYTLTAEASGLVLPQHDVDL